MNTFKTFKPFETFETSFNTFEDDFNAQPKDNQYLILSYIDASVFKVLNNDYIESDFKNFVILYPNWVKDLIRDKDKKYVFNYAAMSGDINLLKYLLSENFFKNEWVFAYAAEHGNLDNLKWMLDN